jgi:murein DD-endopeptidase MepM/ murein hydrolase activator NlpD
MQARVFWSRIGRCALTSAAASTLILAGGCSSGSSRFDFPAFSLARSNDAPLADPNTTASIAVPQESVYASGNADDYRSAQLSRSTLPPVPQSYTPQATPASYSPSGQGLSPQKVAFVPPNPTPRPKPAMLHTGAQPAPAHSITIAQGDSLYTLSKRYGVTVDAIKEANNLSDIRLHAGQAIVIPGGNFGASPGASSAAAGDTYKVEKGDTPHIIADKLGVGEKALIDRNKLDPSRLHIGQVLYVPNAAPGKAPATAPSLAGSESKPDSHAQASNSAPDIHVVKTTTILAPGAHPSPPATAQPPKSAQAPAPQIAASPEVIGGGASHGQNPQVAVVDQLPSPEPMSGNSFRWPVQGRIISEFGTKPDGGHNDGIDVAVPVGTSVKAAENGVVAYAGNELKGYGNLVLIRHSNNWVSAYANNDEILVKRGDQVRRGQIIAKAGKSGQVSQPQLHFELRKGSRPVDPTKFMANTQANAAD